jgi:GNAT superfamily N-acetyltransferase
MQHITISTDKTQLDVTYIHNYLSQESYWAKNIPMEIVLRSIEGSICFGVYDGEQQIGFARVISDHATFGYLADVFVDPAYRGKGISKQLMRYIMDYKPLKGLRRMMLATLDAHGLYEQFGFKALEEPSRYMGIKFFESY